MTAPHPATPDPTHPCTSCAGVGRRAFLGQASVLSVGALLAACGDGIFDGPTQFLDTVRTPVRVDPRNFPTLLQLGGRAVITPEGHAPMMVEFLGGQSYRAFSLTCPHKGTVVNAVGDGYLCPNHGAQFARNGTWIGGQATVDLTPVAVAVDTDGTLLVGGIVLPPPPPVLAVSQANVTFTAAVTAVNPAPQTVNITNLGGGTLTGISVSLAYANNQPTGWLATTLSSLAAPATLTLAATRGNLQAGTYSATITIGAIGVSTPKTIAVALIVTDSTSAPALQLSASALAFAGSVGTSPAAQTIQVINSGSGTIGALSLAIAYGQGASGWLSTSSLGTGFTPSALTVRPVSAALAAGTYTATITVSGAGVAPKSVVVTLTTAQPGLAVNIAEWPALANVGGVAGSVGTFNFAPIAVVRTGANSFVAFSMICPHAGTYINVVNGQSFRCPNHGALFNANGTLMAGSPIQTSSLQPRSVSYAPGAAVLYVS